MKREIVTGGWIADAFGMSFASGEEEGAVRIVGRKLQRMVRLLVLGFHH